jgi:hypothetical protein
MIMPKAEAQMLQRPIGRFMNLVTPSVRGPLLNSDFTNNSLARIVEMNEKRQMRRSNIAPNTVHF